MEWGGRVTGLAVYADDGRVLVHLGLGTLNGEMQPNQRQVRPRLRRAGACEYRLSDRAIQGGQLWNWTVGLNWFCNPNVKFQLNYILERRDQPGMPAACINGVGIRGAYDFEARTQSGAMDRTTDRVLGRPSFRL